MYVYRLSKEKRAVPLSGEGSRLFGGRWNNIGIPALYTASSLSLAVLEYMVHVNANQFPSELVWLQIELPALAPIEDLTSLGVVSESSSKSRGTFQLRLKRHLALRVTSVLLPLPKLESNFIINPMHNDFEKVKVVDMGPFQFDSRFETFLSNPAT